MSAPLVIVVAVIYAIVALDQARQKHIGFAIMWMAYALANVGILLTMKEQP